jgi:hypothetical protein
MRVRVDADNKNIKVLLEIPTPEVKKYRKWLIWFIASSLPVLFSYSTAIKFLTPGTLPPPPINPETQRK